METWLSGPTALVLTKLRNYLRFLFNFLKQVSTWNNLINVINEWTRINTIQDQNEGARLYFM